MGFTANVIFIPCTKAPRDWHLLSDKLIYFVGELWICFRLFFIQKMRFWLNMKKSRLIHEDKLLKSRTRCPTMWAMVNVDNHLGSHWTPLCRTRVNWEQATGLIDHYQQQKNLRYVSHNLDPSFGFREKWSFWDSSSDYQNLLFKTKEESNWKKSFPVGFIIFLKHISVTNQFTGKKIVFEGFPYSDL